MVTKEGIDTFLRQKTLAVVGLSRSKKKFSRLMYQNLKEKGYKLFPVNPNSSEIDGEPCYPDIRSLPEPVEGAVLVVPPEQAERVVQDAAAAGIKHIWMQQGAESQAAIDFCEQNGINAIHHQCILMFTSSSFPHNVHRLIKSITGSLPK